MDMVIVIAVIGTGNVTGIATATATETATVVTATGIGTGIAIETVMEEGMTILAKDTMTMMVMKTLGLKEGIKDFSFCHGLQTMVFGGYPGQY